MDYLIYAKQQKEKLVEHRRYFHRNAEVGKDLPLAADYIFDRLKEMGCDPIHVGGSGVVAVIGRSGKTILLRAETDALPMREESGLPFASSNPCAAHTCGHDLHAAALLGAAKILKEREDELCGTVKLMFQPGEEIFWGAREMIQQGVLENPTVDAALSCHVTPKNPTGIVSFRAGTAMAACCSFAIRVKGCGAHGASPYKGVDPINIAAHIYLGLQEVVAREVPFQNGAVLTIGSFHGGSAPNTIPESAELLGTVRTFDNSLLHHLTERIICISEKTAEAFRGTAEVEIVSDVPVEKNDEELSAQMRHCVRNVLGTEVREDDLRMGADDFAFITQHIPSVLAFVGAQLPTCEGVVYPGHHPKAVFDEDSLPVMTALYAAFAEQWLREHGKEETDRL